MIDKFRTLEIINRREKDILSSKQTIWYFQKSIDDYLTKNRFSYEFVNEQQAILDHLISNFENKNKISFKDAQKLVGETYCPEKKYNLKEYNEIVDLLDNIACEKFFINHRIAMINKNKLFIEDTTRWIMQMEKELVKLKDKIK